MSTKTTAEQIAELIQAERWAAQGEQHEYDRRIMAHAVENGIDPFKAFSGRVFAIGQEAMEKLAEGLNV